MSALATKKPAFQDKFLGLKDRPVPQKMSPKEAEAYRMGLKQGYGEGLKDGVGLGVDVGLESLTFDFAPTMDIRNPS